jgi:hypothetical protein
MTAFKIGDTVQATASAQGMARYQRYTVVDVVEQFTAFGNFVTYVVHDDLDDSNLAVRNGHMLMTKVA